jgi:N-acetylmuramoyl-L-alanine amidase
MFLHIRIFDALFPVFPRIMGMIFVVVMAMMHSAHAATITRMTHKHQGREEVLTIHTNAPLARHTSYLLENPLRLVINIDRVANDAVVVPKIPAVSAIEKIRFAQFDATTSRIVLDVRQSIASHQRRVVTQGKDSQLVVTLRTKGGGAASVPKQRSHLPLIAIDAGHGGKDPGALGSEKTLEKNITLAYARVVERMLKETGRYRTVMMRDEDAFIFLDDRVRLAREAGADVFVSLHADTAGEASARGISVYTVSEQASDGEAAKLAAHENEADKIGGIDFAQDNPEVADILIDLASRDARIKANDLANYFITQCGRQAIKRLKNPNRHAGFRVLKAPDVPSILVEVGFLSNPHDEKLLATRDHRLRVSKALVAALDTYFLKHPK